MKIAIIADIHANLSALEEVEQAVDTWGPDVVAVAGDTVNRGPRPRECLERVLRRARHDGWLVIRGNHEGYVINVARDPSGRPGVNGAIRESVRWTARQLGGIAELMLMPAHRSISGPDGGEVRVVHASMRHDRDNILVNSPDEELRRQIAPAPPVFCCGHTHRAFVRTIDATLVVNAGSVGLPFDGDPRAGYAQLEWRRDGWHATIVRVPYDRERARRDIMTSGMVESEPASAAIIAAELEDARPYMAKWVGQYDERVIAGELSAYESAVRYLAEHR